MSKNELVVAAATKNNNDGENDNPGAVIVENTAEAIAIHICLTFQREVFYVRAAVLLPHTLTFYEGIHFLLLQKNLLREIFILPEEAFHFWSVLNRSARVRNGIYRKENTTSFFSFRTSFPSKRFPVRLERKPRMVAVERVARRRMISCFEISR